MQSYLIVPANKFIFKIIKPIGIVITLTISVSIAIIFTNILNSYGIVGFWFVNLIASLKKSSISQLLMGSRKLLPPILKIAHLTVKYRISIIYSIKYLLNTYRKL